jgi:hypothetical protein
MHRRRQGYAPVFMWIPKILGIFFYIQSLTYRCPSMIEPTKATNPRFTQPGRKPTRLCLLLVVRLCCSAHSQTRMHGLTSLNQIRHSSNQQAAAALALTASRPPATASPSDCGLRQPGSKVAEQAIVDSCTAAVVYTTAMYRKLAEPTSIFTRLLKLEERCEQQHSIKD